MSRTIKRGPPPRKQVRKARQAPLLDRMMAKLPVSAETLSKLATYGILGLVGAGLIGAAAWAGVPGMVGAQVAEAAGAAGLRVEQIQITGLRNMDRMSVYAVALDQKSRAMPLVDLHAVREKLLRYGWVADAQVSRRLPDTLLVHIVEREPAAVWQDNGQLTLIDAHGVLLAPLEPGAVPAHLPLVIGPGADRQEGAYTALMAAAPRFRGRVSAASWVGNRRWDLTFRSGETLLLPEEGSRQALARFAELDGAQRLLGRGWKRFDMRDPTRLVARKPGQAEQAIAEPAPDGAGLTGRPAPIAGAGRHAEG